MFTEFFIIMAYSISIFKGIKSPMKFYLCWTVIEFAMEILISYICWSTGSSVHLRKFKCKIYTRLDGKIGIEIYRNNKDTESTDHSFLTNNSSLKEEVIDEEKEREF